MDFFYIISAIVSIIIIICFFTMGNNIGIIKKMLSKPQSAQGWLDEYKKNIFFKRDKEALYALQEAFYYDAKAIEHNGGDDDYKNSQYEFLREKYEVAFVDLGKTFPGRLKD